MYIYIYIYIYILFFYKYIYITMVFSICSAGYVCMQGIIYINLYTVYMDVYSPTITHVDYRFYHCQKNQ